MRTIKYPYEQADVRIILLENSDVITTSGGEGGDWGNRPGGMDSGGWDIN